ncbi:hypothetical protein T05_9649 [Trichinella murrelli]|uniref:Uncharacterized protein n=1 Tax=Trichinella murrelli TaxID=144512 RepID=A0A0V0T2M8_9BILA|nr:hypothetical protein T05_9649 [Trichinella murrelli]
MLLKEYADFTRSHFPILEIATFCVIDCSLMAGTTFDRNYEINKTGSKTVKSNSHVSKTEFNSLYLSRKSATS